MENRGGGGGSRNEEKGGNLEGLPLESSPYTQFQDTEDYKKQAYGAQGHIQPNPGRGAASSTDAPTSVPSGGGAAALNQAQLSRDADANDRQRAP
ncbi:unnamed protein product [Cuscuta campestris]|uniref:Uncharacterized protein n=1 Tax=Cuscuta campestris TaxID=132261 RepID=A0A484LG51_9ASTE|nr:unnamed protein product [Cuscuta campestris]